MLEGGLGGGLAGRGPDEVLGRGGGASWGGAWRGAGRGLVSSLALPTITYFVQCMVWGHEHTKLVLPCGG